MTSPLPPAFYERDALEVAQDLLGCVVTRGPVAIRITEVEAYRWPGDTANHCFRGRTPRNAPMWGPPGTAYVYLCYGIHHMLNLVTGPEGEGAAVLLRSGEPVQGLEEIRRRRGGRPLRPDLLAGPGKLAAALALDRSFSGHPLHTPGDLEVLLGRPPEVTTAGPRIGINYAEPADIQAPWRLADGGSPWVSHRRGLAPAASTPLRRGPVW